MEPVLLEELPHAQRLALAYAPRASHGPVLALLVLDARLAAVLQRRGEPALVQMRLAWWRDMLARDKAEWPRGDAVLGLLQGWGDPAALIPLVDGWEALLSETLDAPTIEAFAGGRAAAFEALASEQRVASQGIGICGFRWALADLLEHLVDPAERAAVLAAAASLAPSQPLPRTMRPLAVLSALANRSLARGGAPLLDGLGAGLLAMRVGIFGR